MGSQTPAPVAEKKEVGKRHVAVLIDESGSMQPVQAAVVDAINEYLDGLRDHKNARVTLAFFDKYVHARPEQDDPIVRYIAIGDKLAKINPLTNADYNPRGWTPLYQEIGRAHV